MNLWKTELLYVFRSWRGWTLVGVFLLAAILSISLGLLIHRQPDSVFSYDESLDWYAAFSWPAMLILLGIAAAGLAQNFAAMYALATEGIQKGHMKLHAKNLAVQAGALSKEVDAVVQRATASGRVTAASIKAALDAERSGLPVPPQ